MKYRSFMIVLALFCLASVSNAVRAGIETIETRMLRDLNITNNEKIAHHEPTMQERLDTIMKAFKRLPDDELKRLGVDITSTILAGTPEAEKLMNAWSERQAELKDAMKSMMQPAELMGKLTQQLQSPEIGQSEKQQALIDLESLLADIDNSRDFHTIGSWPVLVSQMALSEPEEIRTLAAWAVGTAVKNSYDYQLWVLEPINVSHSAPGSIRMTQTTTALQLLVDNLDETWKSRRMVDLQRRVLYALSSAVRGNLDVQASLLAGAEPDVFGDMTDVLSSSLLELASSAITAPEVVRKVWALVEDLLQERQYVRTDLREEVARLLAAAPASSSAAAAAENVTAEVGMDGEVEFKATAPSALQQAIDDIRAMRVLGDSFLSSQWLSLSAAELRKGAKELLGISAGRHSAVVVDEEGREEVVTILGAGVSQSHLTIVQSTARSLVNVIRNIVQQRLQNDAGAASTIVGSAQHADVCSALKSSGVRATLQDIGLLGGDETFEDLVGLSRELLSVVSICSNDSKNV